MRKAAVLLLLLVFAGAFAGCTQRSGRKIVVCCGAGLMKPMNEIVAKFENETGVKVEVHYGGSGEIFAVLETRGCDVFVPGSYYYMKLAMDKGYILSDTVRNVTEHIPVIAVPSGNPAKIRSLKDLAKPGVRVAIGDPKACAIGRVAVKMLKKDGLWNEVKKNVVVEAPTVNQLLV